MPGARTKVGNALNDAVKQEVASMSDTARMPRIHELAAQIDAWLEDELTPRGRIGA